MGFDYCIYVATEEPLTNDEEAKIFTAYGNLCDNDDFPSLDQVENSSLSYGPGAVGELCSEFSQLSTQFPEVKFIVYYMYRDLSELDVIEFEGTEHKIVFHKSLDDYDVAVPGGEIPMRFGTPYIRNIIQFKYA